MDAPFLFCMDTTDITITPALSLLAILNLLGAAQGLLLSLALLGVKRENKTANRLLAALTFTISIGVSGAGRRGIQSVGF